MKPQYSSIGPILVLGLLLFSSVGCGPLVSSHHSRRLYLGNTQSGSELGLIVEGRKVLFHPDHCELILGFGSHESNYFSHTIAELDGPAAHQRAAFVFGELEARTDADERRFWIIDLNSTRVVASLDRLTNELTGPDDNPPPWARLDDGTVLKESIASEQNETP